MSLQLSESARIVLTLANRWEQHCLQHPVENTLELQGGGSEAAIIMQLSNCGDPLSTTVNRFAPYWSMGPHLTLAGVDLFHRFESWSNTLLRMKPKDTPPLITPEAWLEARQGLLPPRFALNSPWTEAFHVHGLLWVALGAYSHLPGLYEQVSEKLTRNLRTKLYLPNPPRKNGKSNLGVMEPLSGIRVFMYR